MAANPPNVGTLPYTRGTPPPNFNLPPAKPGDKPPVMNLGSAPLYGADLVKYIVYGAQQRRLDPAAVLSVVTSEGGFSGAVGDSGSSFGPFQLHVGGALPSRIASQGTSYAKTWANSPAGLNYALDNVAGAARGLAGMGAINAIVTSFERPADPVSEVSRSSVRYAGIHRAISAGDYAGVAGGDVKPAGGGGIGGAIKDAIGDSIPGVVKIPVEGVFGAGEAVGGAVVGPVSSVGDAIKWVGGNWDRVLEVVGGFIILSVGAIMLGRNLMGHGTDVGKLLSGQVAASARERGYSEGIETGRMFAEEKAAAKVQKASDRALIRSQSKPATASGYVDDIPY